MIPVQFSQNISKDIFLNSLPRSKDFSINLGLEADPVLLLVIARHSRIVKIQAVLLEVKDNVGTGKVKTVKRILEQILR